LKKCQPALEAFFIHGFPKISLKLGKYFLPYNKSQEFDPGWHALLIVKHHFPCLCLPLVLAWCASADTPLPVPFADVDDTEA
jgi:hypothetical protein